MHTYLHTDALNNKEKTYLRTYLDSPLCVVSEIGVRVFGRLNPYKRKPRMYVCMYVYVCGVVVVCCVCV